jgi:putative nucleotidyltransferase with HDIG domain
MQEAIGAIMDRSKAWELLTEYTASESLRKHALAVEAIMRHYARLFGEDESKWGIVGLLHDFDYERYPNPPDHPTKGSEILRQQGYPEDVIYAILSHAEYLGLERNTPLCQALYAVDELAGFLTACVLVRPSRSIMDLEVSSVTKKMKDKAFAKNVNREDIRNGAVALGMPLEKHIAEAIQAMRGVAVELGLAG